MADRGLTHPPESDNDLSPKRDVREIRLLWGFLSQYKWTLLGALTALVVAAGATLAIPQAIKYLVDIGFSAETSGQIDFYFAALLGVALILAVATFCRYYLVTWLGERVVTDIRKAVFNQTVLLGPRFFETNRSGDIVSRLTTDTTVIQSVVGSTASIALRNMLTLIGGLVVMAFTSLKLMSYVLLGVPVVVLPLIILGRRVKNLSKKSQDRIADASATANETIGAVQTVQSYTQENFEQQRFGKSAENAFDTAIKRTKIRAWLTFFIILLVFGAIDLILWTGASDVVDGKMSGGEFTAFIIYAVMVAGATGALSEVYGELQRAAGAATRCMELIHAVPEIKAPENPETLNAGFQSSLSLRNVTFHYPSRPEQPILNNFDLTINKGDTVAIVGPSGAGKSTLFQLLQRFYDPLQGGVFIDDLNVRDMDPADLRRQMAIVPQETMIFASSVAENIRYGDLEASDEQVYAAAKAAHALEFIEKLPEGMDTYLGERGTRLSGGQKQRIAIARAILRDAPILLLDEATSALDSESEKLVQNALDDLMKDRTTLVIAHRLATVQKVKRIVVMNQGQIAEQGRHDELIAKDGLYKRLASLQFDSHMNP